MRRTALVFFCLFLVSCNYNYWRGKELEEEGRFEEANIEYHRAHTASPSIDAYREAFDRTAKKTAVDLLERYQGFLYLGKFALAYDRLTKARALDPENTAIQTELRKWTQVLIIGKLDLRFQSLKHQVPLSDEMTLQVVINSPNPNALLYAKVDPQSQVFSVEDHIYNANVQYLMTYSIHAIGVKLVKFKPKSERFQKFVDFKRPVIIGVEGGLEPNASALTPIAQAFPFKALTQGRSENFWFPQQAVEYGVQLAGSKILITRAAEIDFLPQMLYLNQADHRILLDFGQLQLQQKEVGGLWRFRRKLTLERDYLAALQKNILLKPFFEFREGAFPFVKLKG